MIFDPVARVLRRGAWTTRIQDLCFCDSSTGSGSWLKSRARLTSPGASSDTVGRGAPFFVWGEGWLAAIAQVESGELAQGALLVARTQTKAHPWGKLRRGLYSVPEMAAVGVLRRSVPRRVRYANGAKHQPRKGCGRCSSE